MARRRHKTDSSKRPSRKQRAPVSRDQRVIADLRYITKRGYKGDPTNDKAITARARELRQRDQLVKYYGKTVTKSQAKKLKERGFMVEGRKAVIDVPRDKYRKKIPGSKLAVLKDGTVKYSVRDRRDYIVGFTKEEKKRFAKEGPGVITDVLKRLRKANPTLRGKRVQTRLQWGAFQATKDYSPHYFTGTYFASISPEDRREGRKSPRLDKLTGLHFVVHTSPKRKHRGKKKAQKKKRR